MQNEIEAKIVKLTEDLKLHEYYMKLNEMSDDFYYTNGRHRMAKDKQHKLMSEIAALKKELEA